MADEEETEASVQAAPAPKGKMKLVIIALVAVVIVVVAIGVALALHFRGSTKSDGVKQPEVILDGDKALTPEGVDDEDELDENEEALGAFYPLDTFVVNLSKGGYVRAGIQIEFIDRDVPRRFLLRTVPIRDSIIMLLTSRTADDFSSSEGRVTLKQDIKTIINEHLHKEVVKAIYFTQFVIQKERA